MGGISYVDNGGGGAILLHNCISTIRNTNFTLNKAKIGGALQVLTDSGYYNDTIIDGCNFIDNHAEKEGGAI